MEIDLTKLCFYDRRNPDFNIKEEYGYDKEEVESTGDFARIDCACDNCFYGRAKLTEQLIEMNTSNLKNFAYWFFDNRKSLSDLKIKSIILKYEKEKNIKLTSDEFVIAMYITDAATYYQEEQMSQIRKIVNESIVFCG